MVVAWSLLLLVAAVHAVPETKNEYRFNVGGGILYPSSGSDTLVKVDSLSLQLGLDVRRSSRLDTGLRFGFDAFAARSTTIYACYDLYQLGYSARYYFDDRSYPETAYHTFKRYVAADALFILAGKYKDLDTTINSPQILYGLEGRAGAGLEYVFGPLSSGYAALEYVLMNTRSSNDAAGLSVSGLVVAFGVRLAR
jgi:hypothetical protein